MAWDTEGTRRRLKEAATVEFAERGPDGTTMARIAERAGINKERLYKYFGDKRALFETVLTDELDKLAAEVSLTAGVSVTGGISLTAGDPGNGEDPRSSRGFADFEVGEFEDIGEFAGRTFDYHADHPELARLLLWEGLAGGPPADEINRTAHYQRKVQAIAAAQRAGVLDDDLDPAHLVFMLIALAGWWVSVPQLARMLTAADADDPAERARRRAFVVQAARRLALPR
jgi:AcrR family transcriptional regulator